MGRLMRRARSCISMKPCAYETIFEARRACRMASMKAAFSPALHSSLLMPKSPSARIVLAYLPRGAARVVRREGEGGRPTGWLGRGGPCGRTRAAT